MCEGGALVLAGAGTGKTRVLTGRIARLILRGGIAPRGILAVTFTNKAAREMRGRVEELLRRPVWDLALGTFHGVCHRILRAHSAAAGLGKNFQILDSQDQLSFIRRMLRENDIDAKEFPPGEARAYISAAKENGYRAAAAFEAAAQNPRARQMAEIYALYENLCRAENKVDFGELMLACAELLRANETLRRHYAARFCNILIDEFQDTNGLQYEWLKLLDGGENHFFAVGDDDQSIYAFRGARPENMRRFLSELRAETVIRLEQNYRSTEKILQAANKLIARNKNRLGKTLTTAGGAGEPVVLQKAASDLSEADDIAAAVLRATEEDVCADDIAVLYRTNAQSRVLEQKMIECGARYRIYGGTRFFDRLEIKHALAYLRLSLSADADAIARVINVPPRGVGAKTLGALMESAKKTDWESVLAESENKGARIFYSLTAALREMREQKTLAELARAAVEKSGLMEYYDARKEERERAENLREFVSAAAQFEKENRGGEEDLLLLFLANAALESGEADSSAAGAAVNLMTVHAAKGLEFDFVLVAGLEEGLFPHENSLSDLRSVEEERRLMYVALTRARSRLSLHCAESRMHYGARRCNPPSRFLDELECFAAPVEKTKQKKRTVSPIRSRAFGKPFLQTPPQPSPPPPARGGMRPGATVRHARYGKGVVVRLNGEGAEREVEVAFKTVGIKHFKTALARLEIITP